MSNPRKRQHRRAALTTTVGTVWLVLAVSASAQRPDTTGFVIRDPLVLRKCGGCHKQDTTGRVARLSYMRKAPEGWEASVRRMASLNGVKIEPGEARAIVRYLANTQGLAPEEVKPARFETERRLIEYRYTSDGVTERTCRACHSLGRVLLQRRTKAEWELLVATHRGYYPGSDFQAFRRMAPTPADSAPPPHPMDQAIAHLSRVFPLHTPEWTAWSATMRSAPIEGTWMLSGYEPGRGAFYGKVVVSKVTGADDEFTSRATYRYAAGGAPVVRDGRAIVYTGHQWRGRTTVAGQPADSAYRDVLSIEPGWQEMNGRWFRGGYDEFGMDVRMQRAAAPLVAGVSPRGLKRGAQDVEVTVFGANLPRALTPAQVDLGPGITVSRVVRATPDEVVVRVSVDSAARIGARDLVVAGSALRSAVVAYHTVDRIRVTPQSNMARVGGVRFPKQFAQFEAIGYINGADGKPETADDLEIGSVPVKWSVEEYGVTYRDDDVQFVGALDQNGFFTPSVDGPNTQRKGNRNNIGDVWVVATHTPSESGARPLRGRAHLVVTVPLYMRWEPTRTSP